jgi:hypothetical protein
MKFSDITCGFVGMDRITMAIMMDDIDWKNAGGYNIDAAMKVAVIRHNAKRCTHYKKPYTDWPSTILEFGKITGKKKRVLNKLAKAMA